MTKKTLLFKMIPVFLLVLFGFCSIGMALFIVGGSSNSELILHFNALWALCFNGSISTSSYPIFTLLLTFPEFLASTLFSRSADFYVFFCQVISAISVLLTLYFGSKLNRPHNISYIFGIVLALFMPLMVFDRIEIRLLLLVFLGLYLYIKGEAKKKQWLQVVGYLILFFAGFAKFFPVAIPALLLIFDLNRKNYKLFYKGIGVALIYILFHMFFYVVFSKANTEFLTLTGNRGIQVESLYASFVLLFEKFGLLPSPVFVEYTFGSFNLNADFIGKYISSTTVLLLGFEMAVILFYLFRFKNFSNFTFAFNALLNVAAIMFLGFLVFSKVLSPQFVFFVYFYLFCILETLKSKKKLLYQVLIFLVICLTAYVYPYAYKDLLFKELSLVLVLFVRNILIVTTLFMWISDTYQNYFKTLNK